LAPGDFHLFGPLKNHLGGKCFADGEDVELETTVKRLLCCGFSALVKLWKKRISVGGGYVEK
jgi:hypothetical protein